MACYEVILFTFIFPITSAQFLLSASYELNNANVQFVGPPDLYPYQLRHRDATASGETDRHAHMGSRVKSSRHVQQHHNIEELRLDILKSKPGSRFFANQNLKTDGPPQSNRQWTGKTAYENDRLNDVTFGVYGTHTFAVDSNGFIIVHNLTALSQEDSLVQFFVVLQNKETGDIISNPLPFIVTIDDQHPDIDRKGAAVTAGILVLVIIIIGIIIGVAKHIARRPGNQKVVINSDAPDGQSSKYSENMFRGFLNFALVVDEENDDENRRKHDTKSELCAGRNRYSCPDHGNLERTSSNLAWLDLHYDDTVLSPQDTVGSRCLHGAGSPPNVTFSLDCGTNDMVYTDHNIGPNTKGILKRSIISDEVAIIDRVNHLYV